METNCMVISLPCNDSAMVEAEQGVVCTTTTGAHNHNSMNDKYLVLTNATEYNNDDEEPLLEASSMNAMEQSETSERFTELCRVCANTSNHMINIFEGEGAQHDLCTKIHKYLPIRISESDTLPLYLCYHCASTLLAWHDLLEGCLNAEQKLLQIQAEFASLEEEKFVSTTPKLGKADDAENVIQTAEPDAMEIRTLPKATVETNTNIIEKSSTVTDERFSNVSTGFKAFVDVQNKSSRITMDTTEVSRDEFNADWAVDSDEMNLDFHDVREIQSTQNVQGENSLRTNNDTIVKAKCSICEIGFSDIKLLHSHVKTHNSWSSQESYQCVECDKCFRLKDSLVRHFRIHNNERSFTCHVCGKQFRDSGGLSRHLNDVHAKRKPFSCDICNKNFASNATRNDHRRTHTGERPYVCHLCGKKFKSKACLYIHSKVHTNNFPHPCLLCKKKFRRRQELLCHMTTHTGEKNFICDICERRFRIKSELARHTRTHSDEKPFICNKCGMKFRQRRYLNNHIKGRHTQLNSCQVIVGNDH